MAPSSPTNVRLAIGEYLSSEQVYWMYDFSAWCSPDKRRFLSSSPSVGTSTQTRYMAGRIVKITEVARATSEISTTFFQFDSTRQAADLRYFCIMRPRCVAIPLTTPHSAPRSRRGIISLKLQPSVSMEVPFSNMTMLLYETLESLHASCSTPFTISTADAAATKLPLVARADHPDGSAISSSMYSIPPSGALNAAANPAAPPATTSVCTSPPSVTARGWSGSPGRTTPCFSTSLRWRQCGELYMPATSSQLGYHNHYHHHGG
mmetsp:Transcript_106801/g.309858  ORF Transcript_106801/g.309858 Transcript_106801/m.309858 type:complete len:263 (+) Transcript_106801:1213-2001(+)